MTNPKKLQLLLTGILCGSRNNCNCRDAQFDVTTLTFKQA